MSTETVENSLIPSSENFFQLYELQPKDEFYAKGSFSICRKCHHRKTLREYAVKIITKNDYYFKNEIHLLRKCQGHPNIVKLIEVLKDCDNKYFVMELLTGGDLFDVIVKPFTEKKSRKIIKQLSSAVQYLHSKNVVHRDIKPENLMFAHSGNGSPIKLIDFGLSLEKNECKSLESSFFSLPYAAPEIVALEKYNESCDLWSLGAILYFILTGKKAFSYKHSVNAALSIKSEKVKLNEEIIHHFSDDCKKVIKGLLNVNPEKRLTATDLVNHAWLAIEN